MLVVMAVSGPSRIHRLGLFSQQFIPAGTKIAEFREGFDIALTDTEIAALPKSARAQFLRHAFWSSALQRHVCDGDDGRFTNHSDQPNSQQADLASFAVRDIAAGEEITLDYGALDGDVPTMQVTPSASLWLINGVSGLYLDRTETGWGLFAGKRFAAGEPVLNFTGPVLSLRETLSLGAWSMYPVQIDLDRYVDCGPPGAFINHCCEPNTAICGKIQLIAIREVTIGEELTMDYSCSMSGDPEGNMPCRCRSPRCRGAITNFEDLPAVLRSELLRRMLVADFIASKYAVS